MGEVEEVFGYWANLNHPTIEVEDTAVAVVRFKGGGLGSIMVSNSQNPGISGRVSVHGSNGASVGVQTDGGSMFIAGTTKIADAAFNDIWTVPGEEHMPAKWRQEDDALFSSVNPMEHFHRLQIEDFLQSVIAGRPPAVTAADGRRVVELFTAIYRATRDGRPVRLPVRAQ
jgi:predicted dehydrogenase